MRESTAPAKGVEHRLLRKAIIVRVAIQESGKLRQNDAITNHQAVQSLLSIHMLIRGAAQSIGQCL